MGKFLVYNQLLIGLKSKMLGLRTGVCVDTEAGEVSEIQTREGQT